MRIIFMGTPDFAVPTLRVLVDAGFEVVGVVTAPDKPAGRGLKLTASPVKEFALSRGLPVLQPEKLRDETFQQQLRDLHADLGIVVAFRMLPQSVWAMPRLGTLNLHASLLPDYRGAAPINWAIINGEKVTGATTFFLNHQIDKGDLLLRTEVPIGQDMTAGELHDVLMEEGAQLVLRTVQGLQADALQPQPQQLREGLHLAPKIFRDDCRIHWQQPSQSVHNLVRGMSPWPGAWTTFEGKNLKVIRTRMGTAAQGLAPGSLHRDGDRLLAGCADGFVEILELQLEGKSRMSAADFLRGFKGELSHAV